MPVVPEILRMTTGRMRADLVAAFPGRGKKDLPMGRSS